MKAKTFRDLLLYFKKTNIDINEFIHTYFPEKTVIETNIYVNDAEELDKKYEVIP